MENARGIISFTPCGVVSPIDIDLLASNAGEFLSVETGVNPPLLEMPAEAYHPRRNQYHAGKILNFLALRYTGALRVVGVTPRDLFLPVFTHVYGEAQMPGRAAVVSLFRLAPSPPLQSDERSIIARALKVTGSLTVPRNDDKDPIIERALKVAVHELLHTFELTHCQHPECLMRPVTSVFQLDALPLKLCRSCRNFWEYSRR